METSAVPKIKDPITPREAAERMNRIAVDYDNDSEASHVYADRLLCEIAMQCGFREAVRLFEKMKKNYI